MLALLITTLILSAPLTPTFTAHANSCPAFSTITSSCGNSVCEGLRGETSANCPRDCEDSTRHQLGFVPENLVCPPTKIFRPHTTEEARLAMIQSTASGKRLRFVGHAHSSTQMVCSDGNILSTAHLTHMSNVQVWNGIDTVVAGPGVIFETLMNHLDAQGKALGFAVPGYFGLTLGGFLGAGGHGTDAAGVSTFAHRVVALDVMNPQGQITTYSAQNTTPIEFRALKANLGLLGLVTALRIQVEPKFKVHLKARLLDDAPLTQPGGLRSLVDGCNYVFMRWLTGVKKVALLCGSRSTAPLDPGAKIALFDPKIPPAFLKLSMPLFQSAACNPSQTCEIERLRYNQEKDAPPINIIDAKGKHYVPDAVGNSYRMTTDYLAASLPVTPYTDWEVAFPERFAAEALEYIQKTLRDKKTCLPYAGVVIRFDQVTDDTLMAANASGPGFNTGENLIHLEFPQFVPYEFTEVQRTNFEGIIIDIMHEMVKRYGARPHWGKNRAHLLTSANVQKANQHNRALFNQVIAKMDPYGVFSNETTRKAGFNSPLYGMPFEQFYFPECQNPSLDSDQDGVPDCAENLSGQSPNLVNGMRVEISDLPRVSLGSCRALSDRTPPQQNNTHSQITLDGWNFFTTDHSYTSAQHPFSPNFSGKRSFGKNHKDWQMNATAQFVAQESATYCFQVKAGRRNCGQVWINGELFNENGKSESKKAQNPRCLHLSQGERPSIQLVGRFQHPNLKHPFELKTSWCKTQGAQCTPDRLLERENVITEQ